MNKSDSPRIKRTISVDKALYDKIILLSKSSRIPQSKLMDEAIEDLLKKFEKGK